MTTTAPRDPPSDVALLPPPIHPQSIRRLRIERLLTAGTQGRLALVVAPAGYGKTTFVATWAAAHPDHLGWIALSHSDNDPVHFWTSVTAVLEQAGVEVPEVVERRGRVDRLRTAFAALAADVVLVLDDYFVITDQEIHDELGRLLGQNLPRLHVVLVSRADPPFASPRWKVNREVVQVRARDLAFTDEEMVLLLDDEGIVLPDAVRDALIAKVSGWAAALRLATVWIAGQDDPVAAVTGFASSDATIADYLVSEILDQLPVETRAFLLQTSVLPWLSGPLCDAVTGRSDGARVLRELERRDLFVQAADTGRERFRYHPLFGELLANERRRDDPEGHIALHRAAAAWLAAHGHAREAIDQAVAGADWPLTGRLLMGETLAIGSRYQLSIVDRWLTALPAEVREGSPHFLMLLGFVLGCQGRTRDAWGALERARAVATSLPESPATHEILALVHSVGAGVARLDCDLERTNASVSAMEVELAQVDASRERLTTMTRAVAENSLAATLIWQGEVDVSERLLDSIEERAQRLDLDRMKVSGRCTRALVLAITGRLRDATTTAREAIDLAGSLGIGELYPLNSALLAQAIVSIHRDEADLARDQLAVVLERSRRHGDRASFVYATVLLTRLRDATGRTESAFDAISEARTAWSGWALPPVLAATVLAEEARLSLSRGNTGAARAAHAQIRAMGSAVPVVRMQASLTQGRLHASAGERRCAAVSLAAVATDTDLVAWMPARVGALVEAAVAVHGGLDLDTALDHLDQALALAEDERVLAPFVWSAAAVRPLLVQMDQSDREFGHSGFRRHLLERMGVPTDVFVNPPPLAGTVEQLSERELVVLRMLRGTLPNAEIAAALSISANTLKTHIRSIHRKLGTQNRQEAVARSRTMDGSPPAG